jgi:hypothetical protein
VKIMTIEPLTGFEMCLWEQSHIYMQVLQLFTELTALPPNVIRIKCYDFERPINSSSPFVALSTIFVITITLSSDTTPVSCHNLMHYSGYSVTVGRTGGLYWQTCVSLLPGSRHPGPLIPLRFCSPHHFALPVNSP